MRILALRGRNLTSLAGDFAVEFETAPLAAAGLFAITGPTGAGKSTLLDCLCLALYDRFPRLETAARAAVGAAGVDAALHVAGTDPRTILRHGATEGFAEVDFIGRDGGRYRARWEVRRARNKADGKLQSQGMSLCCAVTGRHLGGTKTETLAAIADRTGLSFEQFRRSVLLAQGDFDAFLKAKPADRADLLELMTGTEVYGRLSQAAYERHKAERARLDLLDGERRALSLLTAEDRAEAERLAATAEEEARAAQAVLEGIKAQQAWHRETARLTAGVAEGEAAEAAAVAAQAAAAPQRARLAALRRLRQLGPAVSEADRLAAEAERLTASEAAARQRLAAAEAAVTAAEARRQAARDTLAAADQACRDAAPQLDAAAELDTLIQAAAAQRAQAVAARDQATAAAARADQAHAGHAAARDAAARQAAAAAEWLAAHAGEQALAGQIDRWCGDIATWAEATAAATTATATAAARMAAIADLRQRRDRRETQRLRTAEALTAAEAGLEPVRQRLAALDPEALEDRRQRAADDDDAISHLLRLTAAAATLRSRQAAVAQRLADAEARQAAAVAAIAAVGSERPAVDGRLAEARRALELSQAAGNEVAARLRSLLAAGDPCPVCGSREHPLTGAAATTPLDALVREQRGRVVALEAEMRALDDRWRKAAAERDGLSTVMEGCREDGRRLEQEVAELRAEWLTAAARMPALALAADPATADADRLRAAAEAAAAALAEVTEAVRQAAALRAEIDARSGQIAQMRLELGQHGETLSTIDQGLARAEAEQQAAEQEAARARRAAEAAAAALAAPLAPLGDWQAQAAADAAGFIDRCRAIAAAHADHRAALATAEAEQHRLAALLAAAEADRRATAAARDEAAAGWQAAEARLRDLTTRRAALFGGEATAAVRARLETARSDAATAADAAQTACGDAQAARSAAVAACADLQQRRDEVAAALAAALAARDAALAAADATLDEARAALAEDEAALTAAEEGLRRLDDALTTARAVLADRRAGLAAHLATPAPAEDEAALAVRAGETETACEDARRRCAEQRARLEHDARQRARGDDLAARIDAQRARCDLWAGLNDVIGSANGDKFRRFAQSLTLDRLLMLANRHLEDLAARYVLQRSPGGELDLQVIDREMGDEVRGVGSLSGGERFLVSLALALGLASMSGDRALVESLFIDEGFGALDADSLDVALSALEALQATGRKVGVISHVQALVDRIGVQIRVSKAGGGRSLVETVVA